MDDFPGNSHDMRRAEATRSKTEPTAKPKKPVEPVAKGTLRKKTLGQKFTEVFIGGDAKGVFEYIVADVLIPALKDVIVESVTQGIERTLFGDSRGRRSSPYRYGGSTNYTNYSRSSYNQPQPRRDEPNRYNRQPRRSSAACPEITVRTRQEADHVIESMYNLLSEYNRVTVNELYEIVGLTGEYTDHNWGWYDLGGNDVRRVPDGYLIVLPNPEQLR